MSYADKIESALKSLEGREEADPGANRRRRDADRAAAKATQPWAERLRKGPFTDQFLGQITRIGHGLRIKPNIAWIGNSLKLSARDHTLELRPGADGVYAITSVRGQEAGSEKVNLDGKPEKLAEKWLRQVADNTAA